MMPMQAAFNPYFGQQMSPNNPALPTAYPPSPFPSGYAHQPQFFYPPQPPMSLQYPSAPFPGPFTQQQTPPQLMQSAMPARDG